MGPDADERTARIRSLHDRLCSGNAGNGLEAAVELFYRPLVERLNSRRAFRRTDPEMIEDGVVDALLEYIQKPHTFAPAGGRTLDRHLQLAAERNVANFRRSETRRHRREGEAAAQKSGGTSGVKNPEGPVELHTPAGIVLSEEEAAKLAGEKDRMMALLSDPIDRRVFELQMAGERKTEAFAAAMGIGHLPVEEQRREVKWAKDRIGKLTRRGAARPPGDGKEG